MPQEDNSHDLLDDTSLKVQPLFHKPSLISRIKCTLVDSMMILLIAYLFSLAINSLDIKSGLVRGIMLGVVLLYEPLMTSINKTLGQKIMGLKVSEFSVEGLKGRAKNISVPRSLVRYFFKIALGWISLLTIHSNNYGQAIHDKVSESIMIID